MKKIIAVLTLVAALAVVPSAQAETVSCSTSQYGGAVCGIETTTTTVEHKTVDAGVADWSLAQIIALTGVTALVATILYKKTYRLYLFG